MAVNREAKARLEAKREELERQISDEKAVVWNDSRRTTYGAMVKGATDKLRKLERELDGVKRQIEGWRRPLPPQNQAERLEQMIQVQEEIASQKAIYFDLEAAWAINKSDFAEHMADIAGACLKRLQDEYETLKTWGDIYEKFDQVLENPEDEGAQSALWNSYKETIQKERNQEATR